MSSRPAVALSVVGVVVALLACGGDGSHAVGRVIDVTGGLTDVTSFVIITEDGETMVFAPAPEANRVEFPLVHLRDHILSAQKVLVVYEKREGVLVAVRIEDA